MLSISNGTTGGYKQARTVLKSSFVGFVLDFVIVVVKCHIKTDYNKRSGASVTKIYSFGVRQSIWFGQRASNF